MRTVNVRLSKAKEAVPELSSRARKLQPRHSVHLRSNLQRLRGRDQASAGAHKDWILKHPTNPQKGAADCRNASVEFICSDRHALLCKQHVQCLQKVEIHGLHETQV